MPFLVRQARGQALALRARGRAALGPRRRHVGEHAYAEAAHHRPRHLRSADRAVVHVNRGRNALERQLRLRLRRHILAVDDARAIIERWKQHQDRFTAAWLNPERGLHLLQIRLAHVERRCSCHALRRFDPVLRVGSRGDSNARRRRGSTSASPGGRSARSAELRLGRLVGGADPGVPHPHRAVRNLCCREAYTTPPAATFRWQAP